MQLGKTDLARWATRQGFSEFEDARDLQGGQPLLAVGGEVVGATDNRVHVGPFGEQAVLPSDDDLAGLSARNIAAAGLYELTRRALCNRLRCSQTVRDQTSAVPAPSCAWLPATDTSSDGRWRAVIDKGQLTIAPVTVSQGIPHA